MSGALAPQSIAPEAPAHAELRPGGPVETYGRLVAELRAKERNAARRGKPTMWAYYGDMADWLEGAFEGCPESDGSYAGLALAISQGCVRNCERWIAPSARRDVVASTWAAGVYARRILAAWKAGTGGPVSLDWLRKRAGVE